MSLASSGRARSGTARRRGKRNPWVVIAFMALLVAAWLNALL